MVMTGKKNYDERKNALVGNKSTQNHNLMDRTDKNMILLVAIMCIWEVRYGKAHSLGKVFEVIRTFRENI